MFAEQDTEVDDVGFLAELVRRIRKKHKVDSDREFIAGISNGGFMSQAMAMERSELFAGAGVIIASMGKSIVDEFDPTRPVSILFMNGTLDPMVPYNGGALDVQIFPQIAKIRGNNKSRGACISTDAAVAMWTERNGLRNTIQKIRKSKTKTILMDATSN